MEMPLTAELQARLAKRGLIKKGRKLAGSYGVEIMQPSGKMM